MAHRAFGVKSKDEQEPVDPISFDIGEEKDLGVRTKVNGKMLLKIMGQVESGDMSRQADGLLSVFALVMLREDGEDPEAYSGREFDPEHPHKNHTPAELRALAEEGVIPGIDPTSSLGRLTAILDDPDTEIEIGELAELVGWIVEQLTSRPTSKSNASTAGGPSTKRTSARKRQPRALTSVGSDSDSQ